MIRRACPRCRVVMNPFDEAAGKVVQCPGCGQRLRLPPTAAAPIAATPAPGPVTPSGKPASQPEDTRGRRRRGSPWPLVAGRLPLVLIALADVTGFLLWQMWEASPVAAPAGRGLPAIG
jgi:hypothetical protein